jgi:hypothetical protein
MNKEIEKAIEFIRPYSVSSGFSTEEKGYFKAAISAVEAQKDDRWIPVTEDETTYPESFTEVMFTDGYYIYIGCCDPDYKWSSTNQEDSIQIEDVKAWKPLPTPWKEEQS